MSGRPSRPVIPAAPEVSVLPILEEGGPDLLLSAAQGEAVQRVQHASPFCASHTIPLSQAAAHGRWLDLVCG